MHKSSMVRMTWFVDQYLSKLDRRPLKLLDVGSYDVNGNYRKLFADPRFEYAGLDMHAGPNVDIVLTNPYDWSSIATDSFDVVISGQAFEHIEFFWLTMSEMVRVLKKNGLLCLIAPNGTPEHRTPVDCYRFFTDGMLALARYTGLEPLHAHTNCAPSVFDKRWSHEGEEDAMLIARKPYDGATRHPDLRTYTCVPGDQAAVRQGLVPYVKPSPLKRYVHKVKQRLA